MVGGPAVEVGGRPFAGRREGNHGCGTPARGWKVGGEGGERRIGRRVGRCHGADRVGGLAVGGGADRLEAREGDLTGGDGAGLVQAERVDSCQQLHRGQLAGQGLTTGQGDHADDEGEACQQDQAVGHHGHGGGHRAPQRLLPEVLGDEEPEQQQACRRGDDHGQPAEDGVHPRPELAVHQGESPCLLGERDGIRLGADPGRPDVPCAGRHEAARQDAVADRLVDRVRLPGQEGFVHLQADGVHNHAVHHHLVAGSQLQQVVCHHTRHLDVGGSSVADHTGPGSREDGQLGEGSPGTEFLDGPDDAVGDDHPGEQGVAGESGHEDQGEQGTHDGVDRGQDVGPEDLAGRPDRRVGDVVHPAAGDAFGHLGGGEAFQPRGVRGGRAFRCRGVVHGGRC